MFKQHLRISLREKRWTKNARWISFSRWGLRYIKKDNISQLHAFDSRCYVSQSAPLNHRRSNLSFQDTASRKNCLKRYVFVDIKGKSSRSVLKVYHKRMLAPLPPQTPSTLTKVQATLKSVKIPMGVSTWNAFNLRCTAGKGNALEI